MSVYLLPTAPPWDAGKGLYVGGCVERGEGSIFRARGHAHNRPGTPFYGWICIRSWRRIGDFLPMDGAYAGQVTKPSRTLWHELAHILTPKHGHDTAWKAKMHELGQPVPAQYTKRKHRHSFSIDVREYHGYRVGTCACGAHNYRKGVTP